MIQITQCYDYYAFGLTVRSEIPLPELIARADDRDAAADVSIVVSDLSGLWERHAGERKYTAADEQRVMFRIPGSAIYCIEGGDRIAVSPMAGSDEDEIRLYILGTCMGAALLQRKQLPLHGSAVAMDGKAFVIAGESGAGKSTLASALLRAGCSLLGDDIAAILLAGPDCIPYALPAYPQQKLWQESLAQLGMEKNGYRPLFGRETKYSVPAHARFHAEPLPLAGVIELVKTEGSRAEIRPIGGLEKISMLHRHTFRNLLLRPLGLLSWHLQATAGMAGRLSFYQLRRPTAGCAAEELASLLLAALKEDG